MTTLYRPVRITTAEQAEALPIGTVAFAYGPLRGACYTKDAPDYWKGAHLGWDDRDADMIGWTALVPIEVEEEHTTRWDEGDPVNDITHKRRLVTPWEEA